MKGRPGRQGRGERGGLQRACGRAFHAESSHQMQRPPLREAQVERHPIVQDDGLHDDELRGSDVLGGLRAKRVVRLRVRARQDSTPMEPAVPGMA